MKFISDIRNIIGNTPVYKFNNKDYGIPENVNIFAKLEFLNPGGSIKDRIGKYILEKAEEKGELKEGYTILEATAGNTGIGLAMAALNKGYKVIIVMAGKYSVEKELIIRALGGEVIRTPEEKGTTGAYEKIEELIKDIPNHYVVRQFENNNNSRAHYNSTAPELYEQLDGKIDVFIAGAGTGGTFSGVMKYLKERNSNVVGVVADPVGSIIGGGEKGEYKVEGIGNHIMPLVMDTSLMNEAIYVTDEECFEMARKIARCSGLLVGGSSGANISSAIRYAQQYQGKEPLNIATVLTDGCERYLSKGIYGTSNL